MLGALIVALLFASCWVPRDPNKCNFWPAVIGAVASLAGGALNRKAQKKANAANSPGGQVAQWEAAGVNPLFGISSGGYVPQQAASIGDAFATAGGQFARGLEMDHEKKLRETGMELENEKLRKQIDILSNPEDPSYLASYGGIMPLPRLGGRNAGSQSNNVDVPRVDGNGVPFGSTLNEIASGRELEVAPYSSGPGFTEIHNDLIGTAVVPGADGEPWGIDEVITVGASLPLNWSHQFGEYLGNKWDAGAARNKMSGIYRDVRDAKQSARAQRSGWGQSTPRSIRPTQREIDAYRFRRNVIN